MASTTRNRRRGGRTARPKPAFQPAPPAGAVPAESVSDAAGAGRRRDPLRLAAVGLSLVGVGVSGYLSWMKLTGAEALCVGVGGCDTVNNSSYAELFGVPIATLGLGLYLAILALALVWAFGRSSIANDAGLAIFGLALAGVAYSAYLTYLELFVIYAICPWCVSSAVLLVSLLGVTTAALLKG